MNTFHRISFHNHIKTWPTGRRRDFDREDSRIPGPNGRSVLQGAVVEQRDRRNGHGADGADGHGVADGDLVSVVPHLFAVDAGLDAQKALDARVQLLGVH